MKTTLKLIALILIPAAAILMLSRCKSNAEAEETFVKITPVDAAEPTIKAAEDKAPTIKAKAGAAEVKKEISKPLTIIVKNLASTTGPVIIGVYKSKNNFLKEEGRLKEYTFQPNGNTLTARITDLTYGEFAMAIYQDENSNGKIDKNMIGIPTEGYAFSNNYRPKVKAPSFNDCRFIYDSSTNTVTMSMIK